MIQIQDLITGDHTFCVVFEYRRYNRDGAGRKDYIVRGNGLLGAVRFYHFYCIFIDQCAKAIHHRHLIFL